MTDYAVDQETKLTEILDILQKAPGWVKCEEVLDSLQQRHIVSNATSVSALIRDLRKVKNGAYDIEGCFVPGTKVYKYRYKGQRGGGLLIAAKVPKATQMKFRLDHTALNVLESRIIGYPTPKGTDQAFKEWVLGLINELRRTNKGAANV